jgi:RNA polymerase sigma-70 factor, ECF subfamily
MKQPFAAESELLTPSESIECNRHDNSMNTLQARLARGDPAAFAELYDAYADRLGHYLLVRLGSWNDADDVLQEPFLRLARLRCKLANVTDLDAYLITVARNEAARLAANASRRRQKQEPLGSQNLFCDASNDADAKAAAETVAAALNCLDADLREIVELKTYAGLTFQQISQVTGLPQGTAATRYRTALAKMQTWFARQHDE